MFNGCLYVLSVNGSDGLNGAVLYTTAVTLNAGTTIALYVSIGIFVQQTESLWSERFRYQHVYQYWCICYVESLYIAIIYCVYLIYCVYFLYIAINI